MVKDLALCLDLAVLLYVSRYLLYWKPREVGKKKNWTWTTEMVDCIDYLFSETWYAFGRMMSNSGTIVIIC